MYVFHLTRAELQTSDFGVTVLQPDRTNYAILDFKLLTWKYMNFTKKFDENTRVFTIKVIAKTLPVRWHSRVYDCRNSSVSATAT